MTRYLRFEKATSRGTLGHDVALEGLVLRQRTRKGVNKKTGRVGGGNASSTSTFKDAKSAQAAFEKVLKNLAADRYVPVGGARAPAPASAGAFVVKGKARAATAASLAAFEKAHGVKLPKDYRAFVMKYGAGELLGFVRIHAPRTSGRFRLEALARDMAETTDAHSFLVFADTGGGDVFGWKLPSEAVYFLARSAERPKKVAPSFDAFVKSLTKSQPFVDRLFAGLDADATFATR